MFDFRYIFRINNNNQSQMFAIIMNISGAIIVKTYLRIERFKPPGFFVKTHLQLRNGQVARLLFLYLASATIFIYIIKSNGRLILKNCVTHLDDLVVEFERRFGDVEFMRHRINLFNNPVADAIEKRGASLELGPSEL